MQEEQPRPSRRATAVETITSEEDHETRSQLDHVDDVDVDESGSEVEIGNGESD